MGRCVCDRYDEGALKPRTTLCALFSLISVFELLSEPIVSDSLSSFVSTVEADDSKNVACDAVTDDVSSVTLAFESVAMAESSFDRVCCSDVGDVSEGSGDAVGIVISIGSNSLYSFNDLTMFCRSIGVMCFSRGWLRLKQQFPRINSGRASGMVVAEVVGDISSSSKSSDEAESRLHESSGTGMSVAAAVGLPENGIRGEGVDRDCAFELQQKVSRFHNRQLRFSSRLPSSIACDVLEKSDH